MLKAGPSAFAGLVLYARILPYTALLVYSGLPLCATLVLCATLLLSAKLPLYATLSLYVGLLLLVLELAVVPSVGCTWATLGKLSERQLINPCSHCLCFALFRCPLWPAQRIQCMPHNHKQILA